MTVLLISTASNEHANTVEKHLAERHETVLRIDMDRITSHTNRLSIHEGKSVKFSSDGNIFERDDVSSVFIHHPKINVPQSFGLDNLDRELCVSGWKNTIDWLEESLSGIRWINSPRSSRNSSSPALQLRLARDVGLRVPETCFTNDLQEVYELHNRHNQIIVKSGPLFGISMQNQRLLTRIIEPESISESTLRTSPCLFQEYIEKAYELRVHVIGDYLLACKIASQGTEITKIDWRNYAISQTPHFPITLDEDISSKCKAVVAMLGLHFGIIDLIVTPTDEVVFLECNSQGHWLWIEYLTGLPITRTLCDALLKPHTGLNDT